MKKNEIIALTSIRGVAALWVVLNHFLVPFNRDVACINCHIPLLEKSYLAVDLFFILSGFILTHVYREKFTAAAITKQVRQFSTHFIRARIARIYPLHLVALLSLACWFLAMTLLYPHYEMIPRNTTESFIHNLMLTHAWGFENDYSWNSPSWSISTEFMAYLLFPFLLLFLFQQHKAKSLLLAICCGIILTTAYLPTTFDIGHGQLLYRCVSEFCFGLLGYLVFHDNKGVLLQLERPAIQIGLLCTIILLISLNINTGLAIILYLPLILSLSQDNGPVSRMLQHKLFYFLGLISYSIYLNHAVLLMVYRDIRVTVLELPASLGIITELIIIAGLLAATLYISHYTFKHIEVKFRKLLH